MGDDDNLDQSDKPDVEDVLDEERGDDDSSKPHPPFINSAFLEKAALLGLAALLSGLLAPLIINNLTNKQKANEGIRARDEAVLQMQAKLLDDLSEVILTYETYALDVSWFGFGAAKNKKQQVLAFTRYNERTPDLVARWRVLVARARTLTSPEVAERIDKFLLNVFEKQDTPLNKLFREESSDNLWAQRHDENIAMLREANTLISETARELGLTRAATHGRDRQVAP